MQVCLCIVTYFPKSTVDFATLLPLNPKIFYEVTLQKTNDKDEGSSYRLSLQSEAV